MTDTRRRRLVHASLLAWAAPSHAEPAVLEVSAGGRPVSRFDMAALAAMPQRHHTTQTPWFDRPRKFTGPLLRDVIAAAGGTGATLQCVALNDYRVEIPREDANRFDVIVARLLDDQPMTVRAKGPLFVMYPFAENTDLQKPIYFARCIWQLKAIDVG